MLLDLDALKAAQVNSEPFPHLVVPFFLPKAHLAEAIKDYPKIDLAGIFPLDTIEGGATFKTLVREMQSDDVRKIIADKFEMNLDKHQTMVTVRANARASDGKIHADATFKKATLLLYLNDLEWPHEGGRLRVLRSPDNLEDFTGEVAPVGGLLFAFKCVEHAWHGHKPYEGIRRYIMMNFVEDPKMFQREVARHKFTAGLKKLGRLIGIGKIPQV